MVKLIPYIREYPWGYERWLVSVHPSGQSLLKIGDNRQALDSVCPDYPLLIKIIQADDVLSVQVHPDDAYARAHGQCCGKSECWYILEAAPDAAIYCGLGEHCGKAELCAALAAGTVESCLVRQPVHKGDFVYIPGGTVHALGRGIRAFEVQQSSDSTYRLYDWGRKRETHIAQGLCAASYDAPAPRAAQFSGSFCCPYFSLRAADGGGAVTDAADFALFVQTGGVLHCGEASLAVSAEDAVFCRGGETVLLGGGVRALCVALP